MRNTLGDLNNHLFAQLERLNDEDLNRMLWATGKVTIDDYEKESEENNE